MNKILLFFFVEGASAYRGDFTNKILNQFSVYRKMFLKSGVLDLLRNALTLTTTTII